MGIKSTGKEVSRGILTRLRETMPKSSDPNSNFGPSAISLKNGCAIKLDPSSVLTS